jgi:hypothetical protein
MQKTASQSGTDVAEDGRISYFTREIPLRERFICKPLHLILLNLEWRRLRGAARAKRCSHGLQAGRVLHGIDGGCSRKKSSRCVTRRSGGCCCCRCLTGNHNSRETVGKFPATAITSITLMQAARADAVLCKHPPAWPIIANL